LRTRTIVFVCLAASLLLLPFEAYGSLMTWAILTRPGLAAAVEGCPSQAFPIYPGGTLKENSEITVGSDHGETTGCWASYGLPEPTTDLDVFRYYTDPSNTTGWHLDEAYANTGNAAFSSTTIPRLRALVGITTIKTFLIAGPPNLRFDVSVCLCDPQSMAQ
jgi:hypothetical protein